MAKQMLYSDLSPFNEKYVNEFWARVSKPKNEDECWEWLLKPTTKGYGKFCLKGEYISSHRVSYFLTYGVNPKELHVLHHCDNPKCVNPTHLFLGTNDDNVIDKVSKGRQAKGGGWKKKDNGIAKGENIASSKLTESQVIEIRKLYDSGNETHRSLALKFNMDKSTIGDIVNRLYWKHI